MMNKVRMVQTMQHRWKLESEKGVLLKDDIFVQNPTQAREYGNAYISSFQGWSLEVVPLKKEEKNDKV